MAGNQALPQTIEEIAMFGINSRSLSRTALMAALAFAAAGGGLVATGSTPAMALCKYGSKNCVVKNVGVTQVKVNQGVRIPDSGWNDPDCKHYGNCKGSKSARQMQTGPKHQPSRMDNRRSRR